MSEAPEVPHIDAGASVEADIAGAASLGASCPPEQLMAMIAAVEPFSARNVTRRTILGFGKRLLGLAGANVALHYVEQPIMNSWYDQHHTQLIYTGQNGKGPHKSAGLASQGWGMTQSNSIVSNLHKEEVYGESFPFGALSCSRGVNRPALEKCGVHFADYLNPKEVDVHAISEGLMIALTTARAAGRHLRMVSSYDSPNSINDAYHTTLAKTLAIANMLDVYHGGILGKLSACLYEEVDRDGFIKLLTGWPEAAKSTRTGGDPRMMVDEDTFLFKTNLLREWRSFRHIIDKDTVAFILRTKEARTDHVVKDMQADEALLEMYSNLGATAVEILVDKPGHADTGFGIATAAPHYKKVIATAA